MTMREMIEVRELAKLLYRAGLITAHEVAERNRLAAVAWLTSNGYAVKP